MKTGFFRSITNAISSAANATRRAFSRNAGPAPTLVRASNAADPRGQYDLGGITGAMAGRPSLLVPAPPATAASGAIPKRRAPQPPAAQAAPSSKQPEANPPLNPVGLNLRLGVVIGAGQQGTVYSDTASENHVIKRVDLGSSMASRVTKVERCTMEVQLYNKYYGEGSATMVRTQNAVYMQLPRIPGVPMSQMSRWEINKNIRAYHTMLERLHDAGITHADLHSDNVLYDYRSGKFNPIDFCHIYTERHLQTMSRMWDATVNNGQATTFRFEVDREHAQTIGRPIDHWNSAYLAPPLRCKLFWNTRL